MTTAIMCLCERCDGKVVYPRLIDFMDAHPGLLAEEEADERRRHPTALVDPDQMTIYEVLPEA